MRLTLLPLADFLASCDELLTPEIVSSLEAVRFFQRKFAQGATPTTPAARLWAGYGPALATLGTYYAAALVARQAPGGTAAYADAEAMRRKICKPRAALRMPPWFGVPELHESHRAFLKRECKGYGRKWPDVNKKIELWWPDGKS